MESVVFALGSHLLSEFLILRKKERMDLGGLLGVFPFGIKVIS